MRQSTCIARNMFQVESKNRSDAYRSSAKGQGLVRQLTSIVMEEMKCWSAELGIFWEQNG